MMNSYFQYIIEVSFGLILFYGLYYWLLRKEACLNYRRFYLLATTGVSMILPRLPVPDFSAEPTLTYSLDFVSVSRIATITTDAASTSWNFWDTAALLYLLGSVLLLFNLSAKLCRLIWLMHSGRFPSTRKNGFYLRPTHGALPSFSFLNHLFLDNYNTNESEQEVIIAHEQVHIDQMHSWDVLFLEMVKIVLWFNPVIWWYRKELQVTHEAIADVRTSETIGLEKYMQVLASQSLPKQFSSLAHHFSFHSTLNRIAMLQKSNQKVSFWKYLLVLPVLAMLVTLQACQEESSIGIESLVADTYSITAEGFTLHLAKNAEEITNKGRPQNNNLSIHVDGNGVAMLRRWQGQWTFEIRNLSKDDINKAEIILKNLYLADVNYNLNKNRVDLQREFARLAKGIDNLQHPVATTAPEEVFNYVDEQPEPVGGMEEFYRFIAENLKYPKAAREAGIEGRVYVQFIVDTDGSLTDIEVLKKIGGGCDEEALKVMKLAEPWNVGTQRGKPVKVKMTLPIIFKLQ